MRSPQSTVHSPQSSLQPSAFSLQPRLFLLVCGLLLTGCVRRALTIRTQPPGALVYVNDELKGQSPVTYDFVWYGWHRITLRKDGFDRVDDRKLLRAPVYLWIPFDLAMELLPFPIHDDRTWSYTLTPAPALPTPVPPELLKPRTQRPGEAARNAPAPQEPTTMARPSDNAEAAPQSAAPPSTESTNEPR